MNALPGYIQSGPDPVGPASAGTAPPEPGALALLNLSRLKRRGDFLRVAATRRRVATPGLVLQVAEAAGADRATIGIGFTASRKVGGSVQRNRARRRLRAVVSQIMPQHAAEQRDYVVIARKGTLDRPFERLVSDLENALRRLDAWRTGR